MTDFNEAQFDEAQLDLIADALAERGYIILDNFLPNHLTDALLNHFNELQSDTFRLAGIGRQTDFQRQDTIRSDKIQWIEPSTNVTTIFLQAMEALRLGINRRLFMGLFDYESHFAFYPVGAFYKKHLDAFRGGRVQSQVNRVLSTVLYLNKEWQQDNGGELLMYAGDDRISRQEFLLESEQPIEKVLPIFGRMVIFLSEKFPHEVLPATRERRSIAGWFRVNEGVL